MKRRIWKRAASALTSLAMAAGALPLQSIPGISERIVLTASAESNYVDVGQGESTLSELPMKFYDDYGYTEQIYTADELGDVTEIEAMSFFVTSGGKSGMTGDLYLVDTDKDSFENAEDIVELPDGAEPVFSGTLPFDKTGEALLVFEEPYEHDPDSNLLVVMVKTSTTYQTTYFSVYEDSDVRAIRYSKTSSNELIMPAEGQTASSVYTEKNYIRLYNGLEKVNFVLDPNGAPNAEPYAESFTFGSIVTLAEDTFTYSGYGLIGWNTEADGNGTSYRPGQTITLTEDLTLYAQWEDMDGVVAVGTQTNTDAYLPMYSLYKYGYTEQIYTAEEIGPYGAITSLSFNVTALANTQAAWTGSLYLIDTDKESFTDGSDTVSLEGIDPVYSGALPFDQLGWQTLEFDEAFIHDPGSNLLVAFLNETGEYYSGMKFAVYDGQTNCSAYKYGDNGVMTPDPSVSASLKSVKNCIRFRGSGEAETCTITYNSNYTGGGSFTKLALADIPTTIAECSFEQEQYYFTGWNTQANGGGTTYSPGEKASFSNDLTLYAMWAAKKTVTFKANGGTGEDSVQYFTPNQAFVLNKVAFTREGYELIGWNTEADGSGTGYAKGQTVTLSADTILYAQWNNLGNVVQIGTQENTSEYAPFYSYYNYGYSEQIYTAEEIGTIFAYNSISFLVDTPQSVEGGWSGQIYLADTDLEYFSDADEIISVDDATLVYEGEMPFEEAGWHLFPFDTTYIHDPERSLAVIFVNTTGIYSNNKIQFACYPVGDYCGVTLYTDDGEIMPPDIAANGSWLTSKNVIRLGFAEDVPAAAVTYKANGGSGEDYQNVGAIGMELTLAKCRFAAPDETKGFAGWNTKANGKGTAYAAGDKITLDADMTLYAQWKTLNKITFMDNCSLGETYTQYFDGDMDSVTLDQNTFENPRFAFNEWNTKPDGSGTSYSDCETIELSSDLTLYAQWKTQGNSFDFSTDAEESGWTFIDYDGDGFTWSMPSYLGLSGNFKSHSGEGDLSSTPNGVTYLDSSSITSGSYDAVTNTALTPDNWAVSPAFIVASDSPAVSFWAIGQDADYAEEVFAVYAAIADDVSLDEFNPDEWEKISGEEDLVASGDWTQFSFDLSEFAGEEVYVAIRHYNCTDMFYLDIDDVVLPAVAEPEPLVNLSISHNIALNNNIGVIYYVPAASLEGFENVRLIVQKETFNADGSVVTTKRETVTTYRIEDSGYGDEYVFEYNNIAAKEMGSKLYATVCAEKDGVTYTSQIDVYSVLTYATNKLNKSSTAADMKTLLVNMLNYGAAAQTYFNYNTGNLANNTLTEAQLNLGTSASSLDITSDFTETAISSPKAQFTGKNLLLGNNVTLVFYMTFDSTVITDDVVLQLSYTTVKGDQVTKNVPFSQMKLSGDADGEYEYDFDTVRAKDCCQPVTAKILVNGEQISNTITYSIQTYAYNKLNNPKTTEKLKTIIEALMVYCKSAETYFINHS